MSEHRMTVLINMIKYHRFGMMTSDITTKNDYMDNIMKISYYRVSGSIKDEMRINPITRRR